MGNEQQSQLIWWFDNNFGPQVNAKAKEVIELLASLVVGVAFTSGVLSDMD